MSTSYISKQYLEFSNQKLDIFDNPKMPKNTKISNYNSFFPYGHNETAYQSFADQYLIKITICT